MFPDGFERDEDGGADLAQASAAFGATARLMLEMHHMRASMQMLSSHVSIKLVRAGEVVARLELGA